MEASSLRPEPWPLWAKLVVSMLGVVVLLVALPWIFMWTAMASSCLPMKNGMGGLMTPGMMH